VNRRRFVAAACACGVSSVFGESLDARMNPGFRPDPASDENGLWDTFGKEEKNLKRSRFLIRDPELNAYVNARWVSQFGHYPAAWLADPRFLCGAALFVAGVVINVTADNTLLRLRRENRGYQIPRGGLYERVSCPNYLGEILEWTGWAVATWSLAGLAFALYTIANLAPRARAHHRWYRARFPEYPSRRRALIPF